MHIDIEATEGDALIDFSLLQPSKREKKPSLFEFLDMCAAIDAAILHQHLHTYIPSDYEFVEHSPVPQLLSEGVLKNHSELGDVTYGDLSRDPRVNTLLTWERMSIDKIKEDSTLGVLFLRPSRYLASFALESLLELPLVVANSNAPFYLCRPDVEEESNAVETVYSGAASKYRELSDLLVEMRRETDGTDAYPVPPLSLEVFRRCDDFDQLGQTILEIRDEFRIVRTLFSELDATMRSAEIPLRKKLRTKHSITKATAKLLNSTEADRATLLSSFAINLNKAFGVGWLFGAGSLINWKYLAEKMLGGIDEVNWRFRLKPLFTTRKRYLDLSSKEIAEVIGKHVGDVDSSSLNYVRNYSKEVADTWRPRYRKPEAFWQWVESCKNNAAGDGAG